MSRLVDIDLFIPEITKVVDKHRDNEVISIMFDWFIDALKEFPVYYDLRCGHGSSPVPTGKMEKFGEINGHTFYAVRDEYGRIVVSDEMMRELIANYKGESNE